MEHTENKTIIHDTEKTASWEQQTAMKVSGISILVNLLLSVFKLIAGIVAHSGAMISDAIHSASDVVAYNSQLIRQTTKDVTPMKTSKKTQKT